MRHAPDALMVFAAGFGTRMAPLTNDTPKPLLQVGGRTLLDHALAYGAALELRHTLVNAHYRAEMIAAHLAGRDVQVRVETPDILDTGGGLKAALPDLGAQTVFTLNPDVLFFGPNPLQVLAAHWAKSSAKGVVLCVPQSAALNRAGPGDFEIGPNGAVSRGEGFVYTGAQILDTSGLADIPDPAFSLNIYWDHLIAAGTLDGVTYPGEWCDVGTPAGLDLARRLWAERSND